MPGCGYLPQGKQKQESEKRESNKRGFGGCFLPFD
jgi:hypothetical protein